MLAIVVLVLGLPRLLRTCDHGDHTHLVVAFARCVHLHDDDRGHDHAVEHHAGEHPLDGDGAPQPGEWHDEAPCTSSGCAFELSPPPRPFALQSAATTVAWPPKPWQLAATDRGERPRPQATGPPRPDQRTALRRTTRLQV